MMTPAVDVPLNTAIADLDEGLRKLLRRELERHGFEGVEISFDAPSRDWSGKLTGPTVDLFLYDLREAADRNTNSPTEQRGNGRALLASPPLHVELTYAVTAWTKAVEDEHRLLSQLLAILFSYARLPQDVFNGQASGVLGGADASVGRGREEKADFWTSVGGQYKASIDYVVHIAIDSGATVGRGPEVRMQTMRLRQSDARGGSMEEYHRLGGTIRDADGNATAEAWIALPDLGRWTASDRLGRFRFNRIRPGTHHVVARTIDGRQSELTAKVPGEGVELVIGSRPRARSKGR